MDRPVARPLSHRASGPGEWTRGEGEWTRGEGEREQRAVPQVAVNRLPLANTFMAEAATLLTMTVSNDIGLCSAVLWRISTTASLMAPR